jgi:hypothetical protein
VTAAPVAASVAATNVAASSADAHIASAALAAPHVADIPVAAAFFDCPGSPGCCTLSNSNDPNI